MMTDDEVQGLVGLAVEEARKQVEGRKWYFRILAEDGVYHLSTTDFRSDRVNVVVRAGKVVEADVG